MAKKVNNISIVKWLERDSKKITCLDDIQNVIITVLEDDKNIWVIDHILDRIHNKKITTDTDIKIIITPDRFPASMQILRSLISPFTTIDATLNTLSESKDINKVKGRFVKERNEFISVLYKTICATAETTEKDEQRHLAEDMIGNFNSMIKDFKIAPEELKKLL